ncbi:hypothetical protein NPA07_04870 [Mycoplasmopsis caviae]|uniref:Transmembrane protein n=1 Tax=Mycoplasmopsis caviae TaxID=55603 RepID=A0A3P8L7B7_9BACT|nr:hypothetical protein [Mycoplasmopsis caviae]UUD35108.1 hypothetical protein NPA07_04870 [Mycoplasmopsis caviae]VDR42075.1 Uncharacterised protein [Mycoplasmopsis caviae]
MNNKSNMKNKIFDNYEILMDNQKKSNLIRIYKIIILTLTALFSFFIWIFVEHSIMGKSLFKSLGRTFYYFLNFEDSIVEGANALILFKNAILLSALFYSLLKNFMNLYFQKELVKKYWIWFALYSSISISAFICMFAINSQKPTVIFSLAYIFIPLFLINIAYEVNLFIYKSKSDPINFSKKTPMIISLVSQGLIVFFILLTLNLWNSSSKVQNFLFHNNSFNSFFKHLFSLKSATNLTIIIFLFLGISLLLFGCFVQKILFLINKQYTKEYFRYQIQFLLAILLSLVFWFISTFAIKPKDANILVKGENKNNYWFLFEILFAILILSIYCAITFRRQFKTKGTLLNTIYLSSLLFVLWLSLAIINFYTNNSIVNLVNVFVVSLCSIIMISIYYLRKSENNIWTSMFIATFIMANITTLVIFGINQILLGYSNYAFNVVDSKLYITQILIIIQLSIIFTLMLVNFCDLYISLHKINSLRINLRKEQNVQIK